MDREGIRKRDIIIILLLFIAVVEGYFILRQNERSYLRLIEIIDRLENIRKKLSTYGSDFRDKTHNPGSMNRFPKGDAIVLAETEPSTLNPLISNEAIVYRISSKIIEPLFTIHPDTLEPDSCLATHWEVSPDKLQYTFYLRKGVFWTDGQPFTADDVIFSFNAIMDDEVDSAHLKAEYIDVEKLEKIDDYAVRFTYKKRYFRGLFTCGGLDILPKHYYEKKIQEYAEKHKIKEYSIRPGEKGFGKIFNKLRYPPIGTGPFIFPEDGWKTNQYIELHRNENYWGDAYGIGYNLDKIIYRFIRDEVTTFEEMRKQKIDINTVDLDVWQDQLSKDKSITDHFNFYSYDHTGIGYNFICWNNRIPPFNDKRVRQAMTYLIDRKTMLEKFNRNDGMVISCIFKPIYPEYSHDLEPLPFDPQKAVALLEEAGWVDHDNDGIRDKDGKPFKFELKVPSGRVEYIRFGTFIQEQLKKVGIEMSINPLDWSVFIEDLYNRKFDAISLYRGGQTPPPDPYYSWHSSQDQPRAGNSSGFRNAEADRLIELAREEFDRDVRIKYYHQFNRILHEEQPMTLLFTGNVHVLLHKRFENVIIHKAGLDYRDFYVQPENQKY